MGEKAEVVYNAFRELRGFCQEVGLLLKTADAEADRRGWQTCGGNQVISGAATVLQSPRYWLPIYFFRFYNKKELPHIIAWVSVIVHHPCHEDMPKKMTEALVTGGWMSWGKGNPLQTRWQYTLAESHAWQPERRDDGQLVISKDIMKYLEVEVPEGITARVGTLGLPLDLITDAEDLVRLIMEPLFQSINAEVLAEQATPPLPPTVMN